MNQKNVIAIILAIVFVFSCFGFFTAGAAPDQAGKNTTTTTTNPEPSGLTPEPEDPITPEDPSQNPSGGEDDPQEGSSSPTTTSTTSTTTSTTAPSSTSASTISNTAADPVYTTTTTPPTYEYDENGFAITDAADTTAPMTTKKGEKITEPPTVAKIVTDYSKQYSWLKWVSLVGMVLSVGGLIVLNVMYKAQSIRPKKK